MTETIYGRPEFELCASDLEVATTKFSGPCVMVLEQDVIRMPLSDLVRECQLRGSIYMFEARQRVDLIQFKLRSQLGRVGTRTLPNEWRVDCKLERVGQSEQPRPHRTSNLCQATFLSQQHALVYTEGLIHLDNMVSVPAYGSTVSAPTDVRPIACWRASVTSSRSRTWLQRITLDKKDDRRSPR